MQGALFSFTSIKDYQKSLFNGQTTCVEAVSYFLKKIQENNHLNCFLETFDEEALQRAAELDTCLQSGNENPHGKLYGVVVALKDVICYKNHKVSASSKILQNFISVYNATVVDKLLKEGAIIIGRNNCDEFAMGSSNENSAYGRVLNALDNERVSGGSSGGSAVAVQAGLCMVSLGSDTGGSVRQPADFCGIFGFKPSYSRISRYGLIAYASSFDQIGIFATNLDDVAITLEVIAGSDDYDSTVSKEAVPEYSNLISTSNKKFRIAYFKQALNNSSLNKDIFLKTTNLIERLQADEHVVEAIDFNLFDYVVPAYYILSTAEASSNLARYDGIKFGYSAAGKKNSIDEYYKVTRTERFGKEVKRRIMLGTFVLSAGYHDAYFTKAQKIRAMLARQIEEIFTKYDVLISPAVPSVAFKFGEKSNNPVEMFLADIYTVLANLVGIPAITLPLFKHISNMPFGLQVMSSGKNDLLLLRFSNEVLKHTN